MKSYLLRSAALTVALVFVLNLLGVYSFWYATIWWYDMLVHFFGGVFIGFLLLYLFQKLWTMPLRQLVICVGGGVLLIGIGWEIFEVFIWQVTGANGSPFSDSVSDVVCDTVGGLVALSFFLQKRKI